MENFFNQLVNSPIILFAIVAFSAVYFVVTYHKAWKTIDHRKDLQPETPKAVDLFKEAYDKTPSEAGFPVIGLYERQHAYLYATSRKVIKAYKTQQNIIRWMMSWYLWPFPVAYAGLMFTFAEYRSFTHLSFVALCCFTSIWTILGFVLIAKGLIVSRVIKFGKNITYLNYKVQ